MCEPPVPDFEQTRQESIRFGYWLLVTRCWLRQRKWSPAVVSGIGVASSLLDRQLVTQAEAFEKEGGFTERLYRIRKQTRRTS